jgi:RNA polymerase sigma-70 factor (ECF subfamily)
MRAAQSGDAVAYEALLRTLLPALRRFVRSRVRDPDAAEDITQIVLLSVHRARHTWHPDRPFGPWWRAIARNATVDALRARSRRAAREVALDAVPEPAIETRDATPGAPLDPRVAAALADLPESQRQAIELVHGRDLSIAEAAAAAGVSPGALKVRVHRGVAALRRLLGGRAP